MKKLFTLLAVMTATGLALGQAVKKDEIKPPAGPVQVTVKCDKAEYTHGEPGVNYFMAPTGQIKATLTAKNTSDKAQTLEFRSGQKYDFVIRDAQGKEVKRWSAEMAFTQALQEESLGAGKELTFTQTVALGAPRKPLPEGSYVLEAILTCHPPLSANVPFKIVALRPR